MSIVSFNDITQFLGSPDIDENEVLESLHDSVEAWIQKHCRRTFESTTYTLEKYDGTGSPYLYLKNYPITAITRLSIGTRDVIRVKNTNVGTFASISVSSSSVTLHRDGSADSTLSLSTYTTMSTLVTAINAVGSGWSAEVLSSTYDSFQSSSLLTRYGASVINSNWVFLKMPYEDAEDDFEVNENEGVIIRNCNFPRGNNNIFITYTAGYSSSAMPEDLKFAIKIMTKYIYQKRAEESWNLERYRVGDIEYAWSKENSDIPIEVKTVLSKYKKVLI